MAVQVQPAPARTPDEAVRQAARTADIPEAHMPAPADKAAARLPAGQEHSSLALAQ